jgi:hypothetical protein
MSAVVSRLYTCTHPIGCLQLPDDDGNTRFGSGVLIDEVHGHLIVSDPTKSHDFGSGVVSCGGVYVLDLLTGAFIQEILPDDIADQIDQANFGGSLTHNGSDWLLIACFGSFGITVGSMYFLQWNGAAYDHKQRLTGAGATHSTSFGYSCDAASALCVVSEPGRNASRGGLHLFREVVGVWSEDVAALTDAPDVQIGQSFGHNVAVNAPFVAATAPGFDGDYVNQGRAYILEDTGVGIPLTLRSTLLCPAGGTPGEPNFGGSIDLTDDRCAVGWHNYVGAGASGDGAIAVFAGGALGVFAFSQLLTLPAASAGVNSNLGWWDSGSGTVRLAGDYLLGGAPQWRSDPAVLGAQGAAFLWKRNATTGQYAAVLAGQSGSTYPIYPGAHGWIGYSVAITSTGTLAVGAAEEYGDWATFWAVPEGPPPPYTYGGIVRVYTIDLGHPLYNKGFEDPDAGPGEATWWQETFTGDASTLAGFTHSDGYTYGFEDFESYWSSNELAQTEFLVTDLLAARFENQAHQTEGFEFSWAEPAGSGPPFNNQSVFVFDADLCTRCTFYSATRNQEDLEAGWGSSPYNEQSVYDIADATITAASFDAGAPEAVEDFEEEWTYNPPAGNEDSQDHIDDPTDADFTRALFIIDPLGGPFTDYYEGFLAASGNWTETLPI